MTTPSLQDILRKAYCDRNLTLQEAGSDEMRFTTSTSGDYFVSSTPILSLAKEMQRAGFRTQMMRGMIVRGHGLILQSLSDFTKDPTPGSSLAAVGGRPYVPTGQAWQVSPLYGMVLDRSFVGKPAVVTPPPAASEVQTALEQIGSFEFDEDGRVRIQPDPDTYEEALRVLKRALLPR